jgi:hypothetical protein
MDYIKNGPERFYASLSKVMKVYFVYAVVGVLAYCGWTYFFEN